jgi:hypothetical protein
MGRAGQGLGEVGGEHLGVEVLADAFGQFAGELFQVQAMFAEFEGLLEGPAGMVEVGEGGGRIGFGVGQRGGEA